MTILEISGVSKSYTSGNETVNVLDNINLQINHGEFVAIVGYSGSGKTTLINTIAGLIKADSGGLIYNGKEIQGTGLERSIVFQSYSLMPWMSVRANINLAVSSAHTDKSRAERRDALQSYQVVCASV